MNVNPLVSIKCLVYNHEPYLRQCLDGFVMQKTNFTFEAIVHDDASTDGSAAIIREYAEKYPNIIKPIYETENQYSKRDGSLSRIMNAAIHPDVKYIAICEGDDYWTDPYKLQKQFDFLESHKDCGLVSTRVKHYIQSVDKMCMVPMDKSLHTYVFDDFIRGNRIAALSVLYRKTLYFKYLNDINPLNRKWLSGDYPMWLYFSYYTKIVVLPDVCAVYRVLPESASHSNDFHKRLRLSIYRKTIRDFYLNKFQKGQELKKEVALISYREAQYNAIAAKDKVFCSEIANSYRQNGYIGLYFFMKLYMSRLPFYLVNFCERISVKLKIVKTIKLY